MHYDVLCQAVRRTILILIILTVWNSLELRVHEIYSGCYSLQNMVGPGEVDEELEPEVKEECNKKYGDVTKVVIFEQPNLVPEESVRIFIEFKRVESAIKGTWTLAAAATNGG